jgi:hypothetical protein
MQSAALQQTILGGKAAMACLVQVSLPISMLWHQYWSWMSLSKHLMHRFTFSATLTVGCGFHPGFEDGASKIALGPIRGALPIVSFAATGFHLDAQSCKATMSKMQVCATLRNIGVLLMQVGVYVPLKHF